MSTQTHYKAFIAMLRAAGVVFREDVTADGARVEVAAMDGPHNTGVGGLYSLYQFGSRGQLLDVSVHERRLKRVA